MTKYHFEFFAIFAKIIFGENNGSFKKLQPIGKKDRRSVKV